jgi:hypothetical protein
MSNTGKNNLDVMGGWRPIERLPKTGMASLTSWTADGVQQVALQYDLSRRGQRQAILSYYEHERSKGRTARIAIEPLTESVGK